MTRIDYHARTAYGVRIPKAFADRKAALAWAEETGDLFPGCRIVRTTERGERTIWRHVIAPVEQAA